MTTTERALKIADRIVAIHWRSPQHPQGFVDLSAELRAAIVDEIRPLLAENDRLRRTANLGMGVSEDGGD